MIWVPLALAVAPPLLPRVPPSKPSALLAVEQARCQLDFELENAK